MKEFLLDRRGGALEKVLIWALILGGFYAIWVNFLRDPFRGTAEETGNIMSDGIGGEGLD